MHTLDGESKPALAIAFTALAMYALALVIPDAAPLFVSLALPSGVAAGAIVAIAERRR